MAFTPPYSQGSVTACNNDAMADDDLGDLRVSQSRLPRLPRRDLINGTADDLECAWAELGEEIEKGMG